MPVSPHSESNLNAGPVVEAVLQIMEQGPQPMRKMKPDKKNPNSADNFEADHQAGYKSYEQGEDRTSQVDDHNTSPKMNDELERRRSISKPKVPSVIVAKPTYYDPRCRACQKLKAAEAKKRKAKRKSSKKQKTVKKSGVTKKKQQCQVKSKLKLAMLTMNKSCQYSVFNNKGTSADDTKVDEESKLMNFSNRNSKQSRTSQATLTNLSHDCSRTEVISQNTDKSVNSLSSYNSNMSLDHEPMV